MSIGQVATQTPWVRFGGNAAGLQKALDFRSEHERPGRLHVVERLNPKAVAGEQQLTTARVPDGEREHASEALHALSAHLFVEVDNHLGVAPGREGVAPRLELPPNLAEVVDLAVEHDRDGRVFVAERLMSARKIDNRE